MPFWKKKVRLGVDLGSCSFKACALEDSASTCSVWSEIVHGARQSKDDNLSPEASKSRLAELLKAGKARSSLWAKQLDVSVEDTGTTAGFLSLPPLTPEQLQLAIPSALARELPCSLNEVEIFSAQVPPLGEGKKEIGIFYIAVPRRAIEARKALVASLGYEVRSCEPALTALLSGTKRNQVLPPKEGVLIVACGFRKTTVLLVQGGYPYFTREFRLAGADFTYAFQMAEQNSWVEAEVSKLNYDVRARNFHIEPFVVRWLGEVKRSLDFAQRRLPELKPTRAILTGGSSRWTGLDSRLEESISMPVMREKWTEIRPYEAASQRIDSMAFFGIALGLVS